MRINILKYGLGLLLSMPLIAMAAIAEGQDYITLDSPIEAPVSMGAADADEQQIEVIEFFSYGCPHCDTVAADLHAWNEDKPDNVTFTRVPVDFNNPAWEPLVKAYYAATFLGVIDEMDLAIFDAVHRENRPLTREADMRAFFVEHGVDGDDFDQVYNSMPMAQAIERGNKLREAYQVSSIPTVFVDNKYQTSLAMAGMGGGPRMVEIIDELTQLDSRP